MNANAKRKPEPFQFGTVTVPDGKLGKWEIDTFSIDRHQAAMYNIGCARSPGQWVHAGTYRRLCRDKTCVMSNTRMEVRTNLAAFCDATGRVLVNGLGFGMVLEGMLSKPDVESIRVIEIDKELIELVGPHFADDKRVEIICADAYEYWPKRSERFDYVWHDIWDDIDADNLPLMAKLTRKYRKPIAAAQGVWSRDDVRADVRANRDRW